MSNVINARSHFLNVASKIETIPNYVLTRNPNAPLCSVVIPSYNYGSYLRETVDSVLAQTFPSIEIIIVDDGSTDANTIEVVKSFIGNPRIQVVFRHNVGLAEARNTGIGVARGKYICCLDSDDLLMPNYIEQCIFELEAHENVGFVYSWARVFGDENFVWETRDFNIDIAKKENQTLVSAVYRKSDWLLAGGYIAQGTGAYEDWEFWLRLSQLGRCGKVIPAPLFLYRRHGRTMMHEVESKKDALMSHIYNLNVRLFEDKKWLDTVRDYTSQPILNKPLQDLMHAVKNKLHQPKKSLLVVLPWLQLGGAEILMLDILKGLSTDYTFTIVTTLPDEHAIRKNFETITNDIFHYPGKYADEDDVKHFVCFMQYLIETRQVDAVLGSGSWHFYEAILSLRANYPDLPVFDLLHNNASGHFTSSIKYNAHIQNHICVSEKIKTSLLENNISDAKISVIYNGIDHKNIFYPRPDKKNQLKTEFGIPLETPIIGFVGRASEEKRPLLFLKLFSQLSSSQNIFGVFLGEGPLACEIKNQMDSQGLLQKMIYLDAMARNNLWKVYEVCDVIVNVSSIEGMPLTVLESFATGCPVAAMQVGNLESIIEDGNNGILVGKDDFDGLANRLSELLNDKEKLFAMRNQAVDYLNQSNFTLEKMIDHYKKVLGDCNAIV